MEAVSPPVQPQLCSFRVTAKRRGIRRHCSTSPQTIDRTAVTPAFRTSKMAMMTPICCPELHLCPPKVTAMKCCQLGRCHFLSVCRPFHRRSAHRDRKCRRLLRASRVWRDRDSAILSSSSMTNRYKKSGYSRPQRRPQFHHRQRYPLRRRRRAAQRRPVRSRPATTVIGFSCMALFLYHLSCFAGFFSCGCA